MTIAACYLSPEGIVLGADSTSTYTPPSGPHYFNHGQKLFEVGENSTLGIATWGLGGLSVSSHRMLIAQLGDDLGKKRPKSLKEVADRWCDQFWTAYTTSPLAADITRCKALAGKTPFDPLAPPAPPPVLGAPAAPVSRTKAEEDDFKTLRSVLRVGFCVAGYVLPDRAPGAFSIFFDAAIGKPKPDPVAMGTQRFWGAPNMIARLLNGCDSTLKRNIIESGKWNGTAADLQVLIDKVSLSHPPAPMRDAIDFTHACILSTIKALKFSNHSQICGGPIEIAVITVDRPFRWVRHKAWDAAITEGDP